MKNQLNTTDLSELSTMIIEARSTKGWSRDELADKSGTTKAVIVQAEEQVEAVKISDLRKIIETGLGGQFGLSVVFD